MKTRSLVVSVLFLVAVSAAGAQNDPAQALREEADLLFDAGDYEGALDRYRQVLTDFPEYPGIDYVRAMSDAAEQKLANDQPANERPSTRESPDTPAVPPAETDEFRVSRELIKGNFVTKRLHYKPGTLRIEPSGLRFTADQSPRNNVFLPMADVLQVQLHSTELCIPECLDDTSKMFGSSWYRERKILPACRKEDYVLVKVANYNHAFMNPNRECSQYVCPDYDLFDQTHEVVDLARRLDALGLVVKVLTHSAANCVWIGSRQLPKASLTEDIVSMGNLVWMAQDNGRDIKWRDAEAFCRNLEQAGRSDWRLPTIDELVRLGTSKLVDRVDFTGYWVWSQTLRSKRSARTFSHLMDKTKWDYFMVDTGRRALCVAG